MTKPPCARYRTTNWRSYNDALKRGGSLLICLDKAMVWRAPKAGRNGRPPVFSDGAIQFCLMVKVLFGLPLRQTTGMVASILSMAGLDWPVPDFSTLSRREQTITVQIPSRRAPGPLNLLVDSTGIKFLGDGEWLARKHGTHRRRQYRKVHLAMDTATGDIRAVEFTPSREGDSPVLPDLLDQIPEDEQIGTVTGDGAFDTRRCHTAILERGGTAPQEWPPLERGLPRSQGPQRHPAGNAALRAGDLETMVRLSRPKPDRGQDAVPQGLRREDRLTRPRPPDRRNPHPHRTHEPLQRTRHRRGRRDLPPCAR